MLQERGCEGEGRGWKELPRGNDVKVQLGEEGYSGRGSSMNKGEGNTVLVEHDVQDRERLAGASHALSSTEAGILAESSLNPLLSAHTNSDLRQTNSPLGPQFFYLQNGISLRFKCNSTCKSL